MLVLSRKKNESIIIGDAIEVTVFDIREDRVRLGVMAPSEVPVQRREVFEAISRDNPPRNLPADKLVGAGQAPTGRMMVFSRKKNESLVINGEIVVVVVEIRIDKVRLGIESPREIPPHRREVYDAIRRAEGGNGKRP